MTTASSRPSPSIQTITTSSIWDRLREASGAAATQGTTWTPLFDKQASLGIGEPGGIAIDPNDTSTIFVGTSGRVGSAEPDTVSQPTAGLFKSRDGGASWVAVGSGFPAGNTGNAAQFKNQTINIIRVDPANSRVVYYPPAKPGALGLEPLEAAEGVADAAP